MSVSSSSATEISATHYELTLFEDRWIENNHSELRDVRAQGK